MRAWKDKEKWLTEYLSQSGMVATRMSRAWRGEAIEDVRWGFLSVELKTRAKVFWSEVCQALQQAERNAVEGCAPVVVVHQDGSREGRQVVCMRLGAFRALMGTLYALLNQHEGESTVSRIKLGYQSAMADKEDQTDEVTD